MSTGIDPNSRPQSSEEFVVADAERVDDVDRKHARVTEWLRSRKYEGLLLLRPENFAWFTSGTTCPSLSPTEPMGALFITHDARVAVVNNVDSGELFESHLAGVGFQLKERPWHEARSVLLDDLCRGRRVACDTAWPGTRDEGARVAELRCPLEPIERERMRKLGRMVRHAVEATARNFPANATEAEIAGELSHRLIKHEVLPTRLHVVADGRSRIYPHWRFGPNPLRKWGIVSAVGSRWGLHCAATRIVCFGNAPAEVSKGFTSAAMLLATGIYFSQAGSILASVWEKVRRIYEKMGVPLDWQLCDQGSLIGYQVSESPIAPRSDQTLAPGVALFWQPAAGPVILGDTVLVGEQSVEIVTPADEWPRIHIAVRGEIVSLPDLLIREPVPSQGE